MKVKIALKDVLRQNGMWKEGAAGRLAKYLGIKPAYMSQILNNHTNSFKREHVQRVCEWLVENAPTGSVRQTFRKSLPGMLFEFEGLWDLILGERSLILYLGERQRTGKTTQASLRQSPTWISGVDAAVATQFVHRMSADGAEFSFSWENVPIHVRDPGERLSRRDLIADQENAKRIFDQIRATKHTLNLIIGSQRVNSVTERFIADLFNCEVLEKAHENEFPPIYLRYRKNSGGPVSCFGGTVSPAPIPDSGPGIYYFHDGSWQHLPCVWDESDAGVVVVTKDSERNALEVVLFGFGAPGTRAMGNFFCDRSELFWPLPNTAGSMQFGVFCCQFRKLPNSSDDYEPVGSTFRSLTIEQTTHR